MHVMELAQFVCYVSVLLAVPPAEQSAAEASPGIQTVLQKLAVNEARYANIEVEWSATYRASPHKYSIPDQLAYRQRRGRYVRQGDLFFLDFSSSNAPQSTAVTEHLLCGFDGALTLSLEEQTGGRTANIVTGRRESFRRLHPYTIPIGTRNISVALAAWLGGDEEIKKHRGAKIDKRYRFVASSLGRDTQRGLVCEKVAVDSFDRRQQPPAADSRRIFWLAIDRNYLPLETLWFETRVSADVPLEQTSLNDLAEIAPGLWYPRSATTTVFDRRSLLDDRRQVTSWTEEFRINKVDASPQHDVHFFRNVVFPNGTPVYEINERDEITRSYVAGG
jgi:hypothetical protein